MAESGSKPEWFVVGPGRKPFGPYSFDKLKLYASDGRLRPDSMVWRQGSPAWSRAETIVGLSFGRSSGESASRAREGRGSSAEVARDRVASGSPEVILGRVSDAALAMSVVCGIGSLAVAVFCIFHSSRAMGRVSFLSHVLPLLFGVVGLISGWVCARLGQRIIRQSPLRASNRAMFLVPGGIAALLAAAIAGFMLEGHSAGETLPGLAIEASGLEIVRSYVGAGAAICSLLVYAVFSAVPRLLGINIDPNGTMGEDSVVLWSAPSRIALASSGVQVAVLQFGGLVAALSGVVMWRENPSGVFEGSRSGEVARWGAWVGVYSGYLPVVVYYWAITEYLVLGTAASIQDVGRHVREQKRQGGAGGPSAT
jgi:hypothetical protein